MFILFSCEELTLSQNIIIFQWDLVITNTFFEFSSYHFLVQWIHVYIYIYIYAREWYAETSNPPANVQNMSYPAERRSTVSLVEILLNLNLQQK